MREKESMTEGGGTNLFSLMFSQSEGGSSWIIITVTEMFMAHCIVNEKFKASRNMYSCSQRAYSTLHNLHNFKVFKYHFSKSIKIMF